MGIFTLQCSKIIELTMCIFLLSHSCHSNQVNYKHLSLDENEILVDKIVSLETGNGENDHKIVKITTTELGQGQENTEMNEGHVSNLDLFALIKDMQEEIKELKSSQKNDG